MEKVISRGYVKWTDEDGVFHKEPLYDHPEMLAKATPAEQLAAEEARRLNAAAEEYYSGVEDTAEQDARDTLEALKEAPEDVRTSGELVAELDKAEGSEESHEIEILKAPADETVVEERGAADEPADNPDHQQALDELREATTE